MNKFRKSSKNRPEIKQTSKSGKMMIRMLKLINKTANKNKTIQAIKIKIKKNNKSSRTEMKATNKIKITIETKNKITTIIDTINKIKENKKGLINKMFLNIIMTVFKQIKLTKIKNFKKTKKYIRKIATKFFTN